ncbi:hypothetical protein [Bacillus sp. MUM 13]|uniref:hypothetical protein n=1 Tax=Bacillus sp. MUM 13 TaxID=1678001 RepID=UPI0008F5A109|nr:hypothetical protein [Bacillus sp. MUM 13]OIK08004.1 hypothetical protein BIV59_20700 [Bacillus sp. MUM 13]
MKRRSWIITLSSAIVLIAFVFYISVLAPYNLTGVLFKNSLGLINQHSIKEIDELARYFKGYKITDVNYLGSDTYEVTTDKGVFMISADYSDTMYWKYKIFKLDKKLQHFTNPM